MRRYLDHVLRISLLLIIFAQSAYAQSSLKGELDIQDGYASNAANSLDSYLGHQNYWDQKSWLRLMWSKYFASSWNIDTAYYAEEDHGGYVPLSRDKLISYPQYYIDPQKVSAFRLSQDISNKGLTYTTQRIDRLSVGYSGPHLVMKIGRQALTWGSGLVFHPMDLFNPFAPNATYTSYKPGSDMLYGQWLFSGGSDIQCVVVPRRNYSTGKFDIKSSSSGIKWHGFIGEDQSIGVDLLAARDYQSNVLGLGINAMIEDSTWNFEIVPTRSSNGVVYTSILVNAQYASVVDQKNVNYFIEYFRNGFGTGNSMKYLDSLPSVLVTRMARGNVFTVSRDYVVFGADIQWDPLLILKPSLISNLDDGSEFLILQTVYSLTQETSVTAGAQWGIGSLGTEFGGLETAQNSGVYDTPSNRVYARFTWAF